MKSRLFVGGIALAAGTCLYVCSAKAANLPPAPAIYVPQASPADNWTGFYLGGHIGGGYAGSSWSDPNTETGNDTVNSAVGFLGGAQVGADAQFNWLVLGIEGDFSWTGFKGNGADSNGDTINTKTQWTSTVTGRVGAAFRGLLVYGKGGLALAEDQSSLTDLGGNTASTSFVRAGWTAGAGFEYDIGRNWSTRIEYDYLGFGSQALNFTTPVLGTVTSNASLDVQEVKAGLNFRFGGP